MEDGKTSSDSTTTTTTTSKSKSDAIGGSLVHYLGGAADYILPLVILPFLDHLDLTRLSLASTYFLKACKYPVLWTNLYKKDFNVDPLVPDSETAAAFESSLTLPKAKYANRLKQLKVYLYVLLCFCFLIAL